MKLRDIPKSQLFTLSIWLVLANLIGFILIFRSIAIGKSMDVTFSTIATHLVIPALFFFLDKNKYWRVGYVILSVTGIFNLLAKMYIKTATVLSTSLCALSVLLLFLAVLYFIKYRKVIGEISVRGI